MKYIKKGYIRTEEWRKKQHEIHKGKRYTPITDKIREKISKANKGKIFSDEHKQKLSKSKKGRKLSEEHKRKLSEIMKGEKNGSWKGGISETLYSREFNVELKLKIRTRDNFICCLCGRTEREELEELNRVLSVNHIDFDKNNCKEENLNTLCARCNTKINRERDYWFNYFSSGAICKCRAPGWANKLGE